MSDNEKLIEFLNLYKKLSSDDKATVKKIISDLYESQKINK